jgi:hypothetical protein
VSYQAHIQTILAHVSQWAADDGLLLVPDHSVRMLLISPLQQSPLLRPFAWRQTNDDDGSLTVWFTHSPLLQPDLVASNYRVGWCSCVGILNRTPSGRCFHRAPILPYFPCSPSVTRVGATPAPCGSCTALLFRLSENLFGKTPHRARTKRFSEPSENAPLGLGSGAHSRRFAQECPEGNPGKYTKEK